VARRTTTTYTQRSAPGGGSTIVPRQAKSRELSAHHRRRNQQMQARLRCDAREARRGANPAAAARNVVASMGAITARPGVTIPTSRYDDELRSRSASRLRGPGRLHDWRAMRRASGLFAQTNGAPRSSFACRLRHGSAGRCRAQTACAASFSVWPKQTDRRSGHLP
jgi:hypothetical protein